MPRLYSNAKGKMYTDLCAHDAGGALVRSAVQLGDVSALPEAHALQVALRRRFHHGLELRDVLLAGLWIDKFLQAIDFVNESTSGAINSRQSHQCEPYPDLHVVGRILLVALAALPLRLVEARGRGHLLRRLDLGVLRG